MSRWFFLLAIVAVLISSAAFGQGCSVIWYYLPENGPALSTICQAGVPIADGNQIKVMWDSDSNGPDADDPQATLCSDPPACEFGPAGTFNLNQFPFNGTSSFGVAGYFYNDVQLTSTGEVPVPSGYFLRIYDTDGITPLWTTVVYNLVTGPQEFFIQPSDWTCGVGGPQCVVLDEQE